ncbi:hypothetical protein GCM10028775_73890 [Catellatospora paridis]|nr:SMC-Scp complex subunit ScpB [Catellatospora paridis]
MTDNESLEQQAAAWVPPWARTPAPEESKGTFLTDSVEEGHLLNVEPQSSQAEGPAGGTALPEDAQPADDSQVDCGPDDLAGPLDTDEEAPDAATPDAATPDADVLDAVESVAAVEDVRGAENEPLNAAEASAEAENMLTGVVEGGPEADAEPVERPEPDGESVERPEPDAEAVGAGPGAPVDGDDEDIAEIAVVEDLAEALGLDGPVASNFDVDGPDDSGEAAVAYAGSKLATPPPGLAEGDLVPTLEAILLVVDEPVSELTLAEVLEVPAELIAGTLIDLSAQYTRQSRGFDLRRAAGGWRLYTRAEYAPYVERFVLDGQQLRLTQASLETLAVVAYKQPVTRSRISAIRGVNCDGVIRTLVTRGMIEECGTEPESGAYLYRTTSLFLEKLGLDSVEQLPPLAPFLPDNVEEIADEQR